MKRFALMSLALLILSAHAAEEKETFGPPVALYGLGANTSCGAFIRSVENPAEYHQYFQYAAGFITGQNMARPTGGNILADADLNDGLLWVQKYCRDNPLKTFLSGLVMLTRETNPPK